MRFHSVGNSRNHKICKIKTPKSNEMEKTNDGSYKAFGKSYNLSGQNEIKGIFTINDCGTR